MGAVIDSTILIAAERRSLDLRSKLSEYADDVYIAAITAAELLHGLERETSPRRLLVRRAWVEQIIARIPMLVFDLPVARVYASIAAMLRGSGNDPGIHDCMIGATAIANDFCVITRNESDFERMPGLRVERW